MRTSIFIHPVLEMVKAAHEINADRIELFTGLYADNPSTISLYKQCIAEYKINS